jgi:pilus assembly protein CpaF
VISPPSEAQEPVYTIVITEKGGAERREVFSAKELSVGRVQGNDLMLPKGNVSKRHARLLYRDGRFIVADLNSTNGTYVNRRRITQATIVREGDRIYIGDFVLRLEFGGEEISANDAATPAQALPPEPVAPSADSFEEESSNSRVQSAPSYSSIPVLSQPPTQDTPSTHQDHGYASSDRRRSSIPDGKLDVATLEHRDALARLVESIRASMGAELARAPVSDEVTERVRGALELNLSELKERGELPESSQPEQLSAQALDELCGFGPVQALLQDPDVTDVSVTRFDHIVVTRRGRSVPVEPPFSNERSLELTLERLCHHAGAPLGAEESVVERRFPDGSVLSAVTKRAATSGTLLVLRKPRRLSATLDDLVRRGTASRAMANVLSRCVQARANLLIVGPRDHGAAAVASALANSSASERIVLVYDMDDLVAHTPDATRVNVRACGDRAGELVELLARVPATRVIIELASAEVAAATVEAVATGTDGVVAVLRAPDAQRGLARLAAHLAARRPGLGADVAREWVAQAFDLVLEVSRLRDGRSRILRVAEIARATAEGLELADVFVFSIEAGRATGSVEGTFAVTGRVPKIADQLRARGIGIDPALFARGSVD